MLLLPLDQSKYFLQTLKRHSYYFFNDTERDLHLSQGALKTGSCF
jgi:hypothetical protein